MEILDEILDGLSDDSFDLMLTELVAPDDGVMALVTFELARQQIVRPKEVMRLLGLSRSTLYRMIERGTFPRARILSTRSTGWTQEELTTWIEARERTRKAG